MSWPAKPKGGNGGSGVNFQLQNDSCLLLLGDHYQLPIGGWTLVPFQFIQGGAQNFTFDAETHLLTVTKSGPLTIVARVGAIPNLQETGRMRLTVMILRAGVPIGQDIDSALYYDTMCEAQAVATEHFIEGETIEIGVIADGVDWVETYQTVMPDRGINSLQVSCLTPDVVV